MNLFVNRNGSVEPKTKITPKVGFMGLPFRKGPVEQQGLFSRDYISEAFLNKFKNEALRHPGRVALKDWQLWGQYAWKEEHGTDTAAVRFGAKLREETQELDAAIRSYLARSTPSARQSVVSEAGDVIWSLFATASNAGATIEYSLQEWLIKVAMGTSVRTEDGWADPEWKQQAVQMATSPRIPLNVNDLEELFSQGYVPQPSPTMNIDPMSNDAGHLEEAISQWSVDRFLAEIIADTHENQYSDDAAMPFDVYRDNIGEISSQLFMSILYTVRAVTHAGIAEILIVNYSKVSDRIAAGLIDREDGNRPEGLR